MRQLMLSLDKKILDKNSAVAKRMIECGQKQELFILIPDRNKIKLDLSSTVHVQSTGGTKLFQFFSLISLGRKILRNYAVEEITTQDPFFVGLAGAILKFLTGKKLEVQLHGDFFSNSYYRQSGLGNLIRYWLAKLVVLGRADRLRVVGERIKESLIKIDIDKSKIVVQPIQIDHEAIKNYQPKLDLHKKYPDYKKIFLFLGRLDQVKNISWLVDIFAVAIKNNPDYLLLIVGSGAEEYNIKTRIEILGLEKNIKMESWTNDPISYIKTADCLLFPSLSEGYGLVAMEASTVGTPIIMSDVGVANHELQPGERVTIISIDDADKFAKAILAV